MFKLMVINIRIVNKRNRLFITYLLLRVFYKKSSCLNPTAKVQKSVICHSTITDFILIYNCIPLFCLGFGIPIASLNSFIFLLNLFTCDTPSILKSNFPFSSSLMEQTECLVSKLWLNSEE